MRKTMLVVFDTESTGVEDHDKIVQLAAVIHIEGEDDVYTFDRYANPGRPIPPDATAIHGITDEMVKNQAPSADVVGDWWKDLIDLRNQCGGPQKVNMVFCGHNVKFDIKKISAYPKALAIANTLDTLLLSRRLFPSAANHTLSHIHQNFTASTATEHRGLAHTALADAWMVYDIVRDAQTRLSMSVLDLCVWCSTPQTLEVMPFGKHKGLRLADVPRDYMEFLLSKDDLDIDVRHSFQAVMEAHQPTLLEVMPFGKHKGTPIPELPERYVQWLVENATLGMDMRHSISYWFPEYALDE